MIEASPGLIGVGICVDAHPAAVARTLASARVDLVLAPHCYRVPAWMSRTVSEADIERLRGNVAGLAPLLAGALGTPVLTANRVGPWDADWGTPYGFVGQATIADSDGSVAARLDATEVVAVPRSPSNRSPDRHAAARLQPLGLPRSGGSRGAPDRRVAGRATV